MTERRTILSAVGLTALLLLLPAAAAVAVPADGAAELRALLVEKCTECHGKDLARPRGGFGYVTDLARMARSPEIVVPGEPEDSELYLYLIEGEPEDRMPPPVAREGGLTPSQIELVRRWILDGAPAESPPEPVVEPVRGLLPWLGNFHPPVVHFPIGLIVASALAELLLLLTGRAWLDGAGRFTVLLGAAGALAAAGLGWLAGEFEGYSGESLTTHRWVGIAATALAILAAGAGEAFRRERWGLRRRHYRILLFLGAAAVGAAGHLGGVLVFGPGHFAW